MNVCETPTEKFETKRRIGLRSAVGLGLVFALVSAAGAAGATYGFRVRGGGRGYAAVSCNGGVSQLSHVINEDAPIFDGDPLTTIEIAATIEHEFYLVEAVDMATHTGTHFDAPAHFIEGGRSVDELDASEFIWPAYIIDVRDRMATEGPNFQLTPQDIRRYERRNGRIRWGSMVIIRTGLAEAYGTEAYFGDSPGFSGDTVQWLVDHRRIDGIGSDNFGPDATNDLEYDATYTILLNDRFAMPGLTNLDSMNVRGDVIIASPIRLEDGSGYQVNPIACHGR